MLFYNNFINISSNTEFLTVSSPQFTIVDCPIYTGISPTVNYVKKILVGVTVIIKSSLTDERRKLRDLVYDLDVGKGPYLIFLTEEKYP